jgi:hypothetical protein
MGKIVAAKDNLTKLETLEANSKNLKQTNPSRYKTYPLGKKS